MRTKRIVAIVGLVAVMALTGACSSDDSDDAGSDAAGSDADTTQTTTSDDSGSDPDSSTPAAASLPAGWPDDVEVPDGTTIITANELTAGSSSIVAEIEGDPEATFEEMKTQLAGDGYEIVASTFTPTDEGGFGSISASGTDYTVAVAFGPSPTGDTNQVTISIAPAAA